MGKPASRRRGEKDKHPLSDAVILGVVVTVLGMAWSLFIWPSIHKIPAYPGGYWSTPTDVWHLLLASAEVTHGRPFGLYQAGAIWQGNIFTGAFASGQFESGPLLPIVLAPIALLAEWLHLGIWGIEFTARPSSWLVFGPYGMLISSIPFLYAVRAFAVTAGIKENLVRIQAAAGALVLLPVIGIYGHFDDVLALTFVILSARDLMNKRWMRAAVMLGIAVGFKQVAWLALPILLAATPVKHWLKSIAVSILAPGAYFLLALAIDWHFASLALLKPDTCPSCGHAALWVPAQAQHYFAGSVRSAVFLIAIAVAWKMWQRRDAPGLAAALGIVLLSRAFFEPVAFAYQVAVALPMLVLHEELTRHQPWRTLILGGGMLLWFLYYPPARVLWWVGFAALAVSIAWPAAASVWNGEIKRSGREGRRTPNPRTKDTAR